MSDNKGEAPAKPRITEYDVRGANEELLSTNLSNADWDQILDGCPREEELNHSLSEALCSIFEASKVKKFPQKSKGKRTINFNTHTKNIKKLEKERLKLDKLILEKTTNKEVKDRFLVRIQLINKETENTYEKEKQRIEDKAIAELEGNVKAFYNYANSFRKSKVKIGPLKSGGTYQSGEQAMANILSMQYESVFTTETPNSNPLSRETPNSIPLNFEKFCSPPLSHTKF